MDVLFLLQIQKMKLTLYPHGGSGNHGCEAIVRSTAKLTGDACLKLFSNNSGEDLRYDLHQLCTLSAAERPITKGSLDYWLAVLKSKIGGNHQAFDELVFRHIVADARTSDAFLSIGGDNYCYGANDFIYLVNKMIDKAGVKRILWGASLETEKGDGKNEKYTFDPRMLEDLRGYHKIWSRESLTHEALLANGMTQSVLMPDPAFVMNRKEVALPEGFIPGNTVGINVSPMIIGYEKAAGMTLENYVRLIQFIIEHTDMQVALIPHVVWSHNDDRKPLTTLYEQFKDTGRVIMVDAVAKLNAEELKYIISKCRFLVAARTHASIAAYSTQVPTLVVGYSVKARGIARDIFGAEDNYVVPVQSMMQLEELTNAFQWLMEHEDTIRQHYRSFMPQYISRIDLSRVL